MAGRMGGKPRWTYNFRVVRIDRKFNLVYVEGHVPGNSKGHVLLVDANRHHQPKDIKLPFPTSFLSDQANLPDEEFIDYIAQPTDGTIEFAASAKASE